MNPVSFFKADKSLAGSRTLENLIASYAAESMAYTRYNFYAAQAEKEDYFPVSAVFKEKPVILGALAAGVISDTSSNLKEAAREEEHEGVEAYADAARIAREEGYPVIAEHFEAIGKVEATHKARFDALREMIDSGTLWKRDRPIKWRCMVCGYISEGTEPPKVCPGCNHPYTHAMPLEGF